MALWPKYVVRRIQDNRDMHKMFFSNFDDGVDVYTSYSGFGIPELFLHAVEPAPRAATNPWLLGDTFEA